MEIRDYVTMIDAFLQHQMPVEEFETRYFSAMMADTERKGDRIFWILQDLFGSVDSYWHEIEPGQETRWEISEEQLRKDAQKALDQLKELHPEHDVR